MRKILLVLVLFIVKAEAQSLPAGRQGSASGIADSLYATGNYAKAINYYSEEGSTNASLQIARAYNAIGNFEKAITQYKSVVEQNPDFQVASFELGKLLIKMEDYDEARKLFSKLTSAEKENPEYYYYLGEAFRELDQPASSLVAYKNAVEKDSTHLRSLFQLGKYFVVKQEKNEALFYIDKGLEFYPEDVAMVNLKALVLFNDASYEKAIPLFEMVLALGETKEYVYEKLAYCYYKQWGFEKAKANYRKMLEIDNNNSETYFKLAEVYRKNKQLDSAEINIREAMNIQKPIFAEGYSRLGGLARERNDLKSALEYYKLAHKEDPEDPTNYYQICTLVDRNYKDPKVKLEHYEKYLEKYGKSRLPFATYAASSAKKRISELKEEIHLNAE